MNPIAKAKQRYDSMMAALVPLFMTLLSDIKTGNWAAIPGGVVAIVAELSVGLVMMFVALFMLDAVYTAIALNNTSVFWGVSVALVSLVATVFAVIGLVLIVVALSTAMGAMKSMAS